MDTEKKPIDDDTEELTGISDSKIEEIADILRHDHSDALVEELSELGPADAAELLSKVSDDAREKLLTEHAAALDPYTFTEFDPELRKEILESMPALQVANLLSELDSDDALDLILNLEPDFQQQIIRKLSSRLRLTLEEGLAYPEDSAGRLMQREFVAIPQFWTVGKAIDYMRAASSDLPSEFLDVFIITPSYRVVGGVRVSDIIRAQRSTKLQDLAHDIQTIPASMDQEHVAQIFRREDLTSAPVVDASERLVGVVTIDDVVDVIDEEIEEDFLKLGGLGQGDLYSAVLSTTGKRFNWLFVNLITAILASVVISFFDATIEQIVALAILMPIVASMGGNAGTQAMTVAVRALATRELSKANAYRIIWKETVVGTLNGMAFAVLMGLIAAAWFTSPILGLVIGAAMIINLICAGFFGAGIPILLHHMGTDPALSSAVFLTTITDVVGFLALFGLAAMFLMYVRAGL